MDDRTKTLAQDSFELVAPISDQAAALFYERLFELDPELRRMFPEELDDQGRKLMQMLAGAVKGLDRIEQLIPVLQQLAVRHVGYGVQTEHYETVGDALIWTLEQGLGDAFTDEVRDAWIQVYTLVSGVMIEAAEAAQVEGPATPSAGVCPYHGAHVDAQPAPLGWRRASAMA